MGQHLYPCERCPKVGVAHYILVNGGLVRLCTACWQAWKRAGGRETGPEVAT